MPFAMVTEIISERQVPKPMRTIKIVADSSANVSSLETVAFSSAPLKIVTDQKEFVDDSALDLEQMVSFFTGYKGKSKTSCPNPSDWLDAFGDGEDVFCVTITSGLSGSYNSACIAKQMYESQHPDRRVYVIDSLSAGPELKLIIEELESCIRKGMEYQTICDHIARYTEKTGLVFMLESLKNFAANGRVSPAIAKIVGLLGIRIVGKASAQGTLEPMHKCRGQQRSLEAILQHLQEAGLRRGKVRIDHCQNAAAAEALEQLIHSRIPEAQVQIGVCKGLCSYYAELGGLLVGYEKQ